MKRSGNDYNLGTAGWQGPAELAGKPNSANDGGGLAAVTASSGNMAVFFWQGKDLVYDEQVNGQWTTTPKVAVANAISGADAGTPLAAVSTGPNSFTVYYLTSNGTSANVVGATYNGATWSAPATVVGSIDPETPLAATTDGSGHPTVLYTTGGYNTSTTTLMSSTNLGNGWMPATVAASRPHRCPASPRRPLCRTA